MEPFYNAAKASGKGGIMNPPITLPTPGKADVIVTILSDPDGYEICFVGDIGFYDLATPLYDRVDWGLRAARGGDGAAPPMAGKKLAPAKGMSAVKESAEVAKLAEGSKLVVLDFGAAWCKNCTKLQPFCEGLAETMSDVTFASVDIDDAEEVRRGWAGGRCDAMACAPPCLVSDTRCSLTPCAALPTNPPCLVRSSWRSTASPRCPTLSSSVAARRWPTTSVQRRKVSRPQSSPRRHEALCPPTEETEGRSCHVWGRDVWAGARSSKLCVWRDMLCAERGRQAFPWRACVLFVCGGLQTLVNSQHLCQVV